MKTTSKKRAPVVDDYLNLVRRFPLRPIRTRSDYESAMQILSDLSADDDASAGESDYADVLARLKIDHTGPGS